MATDASITNGHTKRVAEEAPGLESSSKKPLTLAEESFKKLGLELPKRNFTTQDRQKPPWTDYSRAIFRAKNEMYDITYASGYMRWWFDEHKGMPEPVSPPPNSVWRIYLLKRQKDLGFAMSGKTGAKERKQVSNEWASMSDDDKQKYVEEAEKNKVKYEADVERYEEEVKAWQAEKKQRPPRTDGQETCNCKMCTGEDGLGPSAPVR